MSDRLIKLAFNRQIENLKLVKIKIPQRSLVSFILFLLYLTPLFKELKLNYKTIGYPSYIDDINLVVTNKSEKLNIIGLEKAVELAF